MSSTPSASSEQTVLLLDVMDTLVHDPFFVEVLDHLGMTLERLFETKDKEAWLTFERDEITEEEYARRFWLDRRPVDLEEVKRVMVEGYRVLDGIESLLTDLNAQGVPMFALSNYPRWWTLIEDKLELSRFLEWRFVSCQTGYRKPHPRSYTGPAEALGVPVERCLFVDDRGSNCKGAVEVGMRAIKFESAAQLRNALVDAGVLRD